MLHVAFQGFEVVIDGRKYFAFSKFEGTGQNATSYCDETMSGWTHDILGRNGNCYYGKKVKSLPAKHHLLGDYKTRK